MFHISTLNDVLRLAVRHGDRRVMRWQAPDGAWRTITGGDLLEKVHALASALRVRGVSKGDRVALLSENRWEWPVVDFAAFALGAVDVPLYATVTAEQAAYMLRDCGCKVLFVSTRDQLRKLPPRAELPNLTHVVVMDEGKWDGAESFRALLGEGSAASNAETGGDWIVDLTPQDLATIIYTSGTTGQPKGVILTHGNFAANLNVSTCDFHFDETDSCISFLPLSHVTARHVDYALLCHGANLAYCSNLNQLPEAMKAIRPTVFVGVPRVYEKIRQSVESKAGASRVRARILRLALAIGGRHRATLLQGRSPASLLWKLADRVAFVKIRDAFGGCVKIFVSGAAPLGMDTAGWFADVGIRLLEGYGLTETSPVIGVNTPKSLKIGSVGRVLPNLRVRFAEDGELEVEGPSVFSSYWQHEQESRDAFTPDGWFRTGDIGNLDKDGFLFITDRKKELLKTSGGKLIAPQPIETRLKSNTLVAHAALVGDRQKFASVLISPNFEALESWARAKGLQVADRSALVREGSVRKLYQGVVDSVNKGLAQYETVKKVAIVPEEWTIESGELTPSMKLKRRVIEQRYAERIRDFYRS